MIIINLCKNNVNKIVWVVKKSNCVIKSFKLQGLVPLGMKNIWHRQIQAHFA